MSMEREWTESELALKAFMEAAGHELCPICRCCDVFPESAPCWDCGGFSVEADWDDEWDDGYCPTCEGEGEIYFKKCIGGCGDTPHGKLTTLPPEAPNCSEVTSVAASRKSKEEDD